MFYTALEFPLSRCYQGHADFIRQIYYMFLKYTGELLSWSNGPQVVGSTTLLDLIFKGFGNLFTLFVILYIFFLSSQGFSMFEHHSKGWFSNGKVVSFSLTYPLKTVNWMFLLYKAPKQHIGKQSARRISLFNYGPRERQKTAYGSH